VQFVIVYSLSRFAREKFDHFALHAHLNSLGISLRSATEPIDETPTGKLMEGVLAAVAQFDNDVRSDRSRTGMEAALALGRWVFGPLLGYLPGGHRSRPSLVLDPERAPLVRRAFEEIATGRHTQTEVLALVTRLGLRTRRDLPVTPQSLRDMLANPVHAGQITSAKFDVAMCGDFEAIVSEELFYRVQAVLTGRATIVATRPRNRPDFPLRNFVRCAVCNKTLTASWSRGNGGLYAYYHCQQRCGALNVAKGTLEGLFSDELLFLQPTPGYMRLVKEHILNVWRQRSSDVQKEVSAAEARANTIRQKLDRLEHAYIFDQSIDSESYVRHRDHLRQELALARIGRYGTQLEEIDVEGILAFAEQVLPSAANIWIQASLEQKQRLQALIFPDGIAFDGKAFHRTNVTGFVFSYLDRSGAGKSDLVTLNLASWNLINSWLQGLDLLRRIA
jgi:site-specific DNA recombinase